MRFYPPATFLLLLFAGLTLCEPSAKEDHSLSKSDSSPQFRKFPIRQLNQRQYAAPMQYSNTYSSPSSASYTSVSNNNNPSYSSPSSSGYTSVSSGPSSSYSSSYQYSYNTGSQSAPLTSYSFNISSAPTSVITSNNAQVLPGYGSPASSSFTFGLPTTAGGSSSSYTSYNSYGSRPNNGASSLINSLYGGGLTSGNIVQQTPSPSVIVSSSGYSSQQSGQLQTVGGYGGSSAPLTAAGPICQQASYNATVPDNAAIGTTVVRVRATDSQSGQLNYQITDPVFGSFDINPLTGDVTVKSNLLNFARAIEFTVQATNQQTKQFCTSNVRISFIQTAPIATTQPTVYSGYGSQPAPSYGPAPSAVNYGSFTAAPLVATPAPNSGYGQPSAPLIATPVGYGQSSQQLVATPAPATPSSYGQPSQPLIATPAVGYGTPSAPIIAAPSSNYGQPSQQLVATPAPSIGYQPATPSSYGQPSQPIIAAPSPYGSPSAPIIAAPSSSYGGQPSAPLISNPAPAPPYGQSSASLTATPSPSSYGPPPTVSDLSFGVAPGGSSNLGYDAPPPNPPTINNPPPLNSGISSFPVNAVTFSPFPITGSASGSLTAAASTQTFTCAISPSTGQLIRMDSSNFGSTGGGVGFIGSDSVPTSPLSGRNSTTNLNWSFFVPAFSGTATNVGNVNTFGDGSSFSLMGNPAFVINPQTGDITLTRNYCPSASPMQENLMALAQSATLGPVRGNVSVVIFASPDTVRACQGAASPPTGVSTSAPIGQLGAVTGVIRSGDAVAVDFVGDTSFTVNQCNPAATGGIPVIAGFFRARFTPNVDLSKLRITLSNSLFKPALPVLCDSSFVCNITITFSQPIDTTFQGSYLVTTNLAGGGLANSSMRFQVRVQCREEAADAVPLPPRRGIVDPSSIVPELPPCGVPSLSADVSEDVPVGTNVLALPTNSNPGFKYRIADSSAYGFFDLVDPGNIVVSSPLFEPSLDSVFVRIVGMAGGNDVCGIDVYLGIKNVNRNGPTFDQDAYNFAIDCGLQMESVGTVSASDIDKGRNNIRRFFLAPEDTPIASVDPASGKLRLRKQINDTVTFSVFVENPGTQLRSSAQVTISCVGGNAIFSGRTATRPPSTTTRRPTIPVTPRRPLAISLQPVSFPMTVVVNTNGSTTRRPA